MSIIPVSAMPDQYLIESPPKTIKIRRPGKYRVDMLVVATTNGHSINIAKPVYVHDLPGLVTLSTRYHLVELDPPKPEDPREEKIRKALVGYLADIQIDAIVADILKSLDDNDDTEDGQ